MAKHRKITQDSEWQRLADLVVREARKVVKKDEDDRAYNVHNVYLGDLRRTIRALDAMEDDSRMFSRSVRALEKDTGLQQFLRIVKMRPHSTALFRPTWKRERARALRNRWIRVVHNPTRRRQGTKWVLVGGEHRLELTKLGRELVDFYL